MAKVVFKAQCLDQKYNNLERSFNMTAQIF